MFKDAFDLVKQQQYQAAIILFRKGLDIDPADANARFYLAESLAQLGDTEKAKDQYEMTLLLAPDSKQAALAHVQLGKLNVATGASSVVTSANIKKTYVYNIVNYPWIIVGPSGDSSGMEVTRQIDSTSIARRAEDFISYKARDIRSDGASFGNWRFSVVANCVTFDRQENGSNMMPTYPQTRNRREVEAACEHLTDR